MLPTIVMAEGAGLPGAEFGIVGVVTVGLLGFLGFILRHVLTVTIPKMQDSHTSVVAKLIETNSLDQREARELFRTEAKLEREACERRHRENAVAWDDHRREIIEGLRETRHAVKTLEHQIGLAVALMTRDEGCEETGR